MHEKHAKKGLAVISVSLDPPDDKDQVLKFLKKQNALFTNLLLDEAPKGWQEMFDIFGPPAAMIYDRDGKLAVRFDNNDPAKTYTPADVEKAALKILER